MPLSMPFPKLSIIIVAMNSERTLPECLEYIKKQTYPSIDEVLIVDGGSTDNTISIANKSGLPIQIVQGGYATNQEPRRAVGVEHAQNEFCVFIDTDNYLTNPNWLEEMVRPLLEEKDAVAAQTLRYAVPKQATLLNRYFGLLGANDPLAYYLGKADRLSWAFDEWNLLGTIIKNNEKYLVVTFDKDDYPTVGCNGIVFKKSLLMKSGWGSPENFFHTDVWVDVAQKGYNTFVVVKNEIYHNTSENFMNFIFKRKAYMQMHHAGLKAKRRYRVFNSKNPNDLKKLILFIFYSVTVVEPVFESIRGFIKKPDTAWFLHPFMCLGITVAYTYSIIYNVLRKNS